VKSLYVFGGVLAIGAVSACTQSQPVGPAPPPPPLAVAAPAASPVSPATFDGIYAGSLTSAAGPVLTGPSGAGNASKCWEYRRAKMTVRKGTMVMEYPNWKGHILHYRGTVDAAGAVNLRHTNRDGSIAILTAEISNNQLIGSMRRGPCIWDVKLAKQ
jgi:hypothetical protein